MTPARLGLAFAFATLAANAWAQDWPGRPPTGPDVQAAIDQIRHGQQRAGAEILKRLADQGRADAQMQIGVVYMSGAEGFPRNGAEGCEYERRASATRADAMHILGECYQYGYGGEKNAEKAKAAFQRAADMGFAKSKCALGNMLIAEGRDLEHAVDLCRQAAEAGDQDAQTDLGDFYLAGKLMPRDMTQARHWYELAATKNQANAAFTLGSIYWNGDGVAKDNVAAAKYWRVAYDHGRVDAAKLLGDEALVRAGSASSAERDAVLHEALDWYEKAMNAADERVRKTASEQAALIRRLQSTTLRDQQGS